MAAFIWTLCITSTLHGAYMYVYVTLTTEVVSVTYASCNMFTLLPHQVYLMFILTYFRYLQVLIILGLYEYPQANVYTCIYSRDYRMSSSLSILVKYISMLQVYCKYTVG